MKGEVINFEVLRIESELDKYAETKSLPHIILDGVYSLDDICDIHYPNLSIRHQQIADDLKKNYHTTLQHCITSLRISLKKEYTYIMNDLATEHESFRFSHILGKYRSSINPIKALYYELREVKRSYTSTNEHHVWLVDILADKEYKHIILDALQKDIDRLEKIVKRFYLPITRNSDAIPLELFHAKQTISDFRHYYETFSYFNAQQFE